MIIQRKVAKLKKLLVVAVPGMYGIATPWKRIEDEFLRLNVFTDREVTWCFFPHGVKALSRTRLDDVARNLGAEISQRWQHDHGYDEVILVGHSIGALLARKAWLDSIDSRQGNEYAPASWGVAVSRFVLFAGLSRGVDMETSLGRRIFSRALEFLPGRFSSEDVHRGSVFITNLRISWMRLMAELPSEARPVCVQLLGTRDTVVAREDSIDVDVFPTSRTISIPNASHGDLHLLGGKDGMEGRIDVFVSAFTSTLAAGSRAAVIDSTPNQRILMVVHGIRATRTDEWLKYSKKIAKENWPDVKVVTPTYGFLSAFRFVIPSVRKRYARFFRDFYTEVICRNRDARIYVLCHSNGTYALGHCLQEFQAISVERVALAGSVLPTDYPWSSLIDRKQVLSVRNDCASRDFPVALLCSALRGLGMRDIGTGGFNGFFGGAVEEVRYHPGGHGAMLKESNLDSMLRYLLNDEEAGEPVKLIDDVPKMRRLSRAMPLLTVVLVATAVFGVSVGVSAHGWWFATSLILIVAFVFVFLDIY